MLTKAKFELNLVPRMPRMVGLFPCGECTYCKRGYIIPASSFIIKQKNMYKQEVQLQKHGYFIYC